MRTAPSDDDTRQNTQAKGADRSREGAEKSIPLKEAYRVLQERFPEGLAGVANAIPVRIGSNDLNLLVLDRGGDTMKCLAFFLPDTSYARKTIYVSNTGRVSADGGDPPEGDLTDHEPDFSGMTNEEILLSAVQQLQDVPSVENLRQGKLESLLARMEQVHGPICVVKSAKQPNDISIEEVSILDPESGGDNGDYAHVALLNFTFKKSMSEKKALARILDLDGEEDEALEMRVHAMVGNLVRANLLKRQGASYVSNFELVRGR